MNYPVKSIVILLFSFLSLSQYVSGQEPSGGYVNQMNNYIKNYVETHEVVKGEDRQHLHFFQPDSNYRVIATFEKLEDKAGFKMLTSQRSSQQYFRYGKIHFIINGTAHELTVYQSKDLMDTEKYKDYLFIPFTDITSGVETYNGGRYIDISRQDITDNKVTIDFNKAYNPYCCYASGYHCPIPPKENALNVAIKAGEKKYTKPVH
jgi:uncharacterized protein (DUF1684 family)